MDADLKAELNALADQTEQRARIHLDADRDADMRRVLSDGVCRIVDVCETTFPPAIGTIDTDLGERLPVFDLLVFERARALIDRRVKLEIRISTKGTRYVIGLLPMPVDMTIPTWPCPKCAGVSIPRYDMQRDKTYYQCVVCHYQMEVGP